MVVTWIVLIRLRLCANKSLKMILVFSLYEWYIYSLKLIVGDRYLRKMHIRRLWTREQPHQTFGSNPRRPFFGSLWCILAGNEPSTVCEGRRLLANGTRRTTGTFDPRSRADRTMGGSIRRFQILLDAIRRAQGRETWSAKVVSKTDVPYTLLKLGSGLKD